MICEEERQELISELVEAQRVMYGEHFCHDEEWKRWWQEQGGDIVTGLHDLVCGVDSEVESDAERIQQAEDGDVFPIGIPQFTDVMDLAVARAIGLKSALLYEGKVLVTPREWDEIRGIEHTTCEGDVACIPFQPSVDLNAAFAAAEKVGMFNDYVHSSRMMMVGKQWGVCWGEETEDERSRAPTPALAICAAILKLKEKSDG